MRILLAFSLLLAFQTARAEESLCNGNEAIVFSCHVGRKIISLCRPPESPQALTYRYGTPKRLELVYPGRAPKGRGKFYTSSSPLFGGGATTLAFQRAGYEYKIYSMIGRADSDDPQADRIPIFEDGLVISRRGKQLKRLVCDDGGDGFREDIDWIPSQTKPAADQAD